MIPARNKLTTLFRRDRSVHKVPLTLRDLDQAMQLAVNEQREAATLAKARETLLANPSQSSATGSRSASPTATTVTHKRSILLRLALFARACAAATVVLAGVIALIVWTPPWVYGIAISLTAIVPIVLSSLMIRLLRRSMEIQRNGHEGPWMRVLAMFARGTSWRTNSPDHQVADVD